MNAMTHHAQTGQPAQISTLDSSVSVTMVMLDLALNVMTSTSAFWALISAMKILFVQTLLAVTHVPVKADFPAMASAVMMSMSAQMRKIFVVITQSV